MMELASPRPGDGSQLVLMHPAAKALSPDLYADLVPRGRRAAGEIRDGSQLLKTCSHSSQC